MTFRPRDYQQRFVDSILNEWKEVQSTLLVAPTGVGKTTTFAMIVSAMQPKRALILARQRELIEQAKQQIEAITGLSCDVEMADQKADDSMFGKSHAVIATVQSMMSGKDRKRMERFNPMEYGVLVHDEAHESVADGSMQIIEYFKKNPALKILGVTAVPDRADEVALGKVFETVAADYEIVDAIQDGWLVGIEQYSVPVEGLDFSHIRTTAGDLNQGDLAAVMENESVVQGVVQPTLETMYDLPVQRLSDVPVEQWGQFLDATGKKPRVTLVFTVSVKQAEMLSDIFNRVKGGMAAWVCGKTNKEKRSELVRDYKAGRIPLMVNVNTLSQGFDAPIVEVVVQAAPTKSRCRFAQRIGRGTRPLPGVVDPWETAEERRAAIAASAKPVLTLIDLCGNSGRHRLVSSADILGGNYDDEVVARAKRNAEKAGKPVRMEDELEEAQRQIEEAKLREEARKARLVAKARYTRTAVNPFDVLGISPVRTRGWDSGKVLSEKQRGVLRKQGIDPDKLEYAQAKQVLNEIFERWRNRQCTFGQAKVLKRYGLDINVPMTQASAWIDAIAKNGWKKPDFLEVPVGDEVPY
jgi:superfamily II DNA or RNA helicase